MSCAPAAIQAIRAVPNVDLIRLPIRQVKQEIPTASALIETLPPAHRRYHYLQFIARNLSQNRHGAGENDGKVTRCLGSAQWPLALVSSFHPHRDHRIDAILINRNGVDNAG